MPSFNFHNSREDRVRAKQFRRDATKVERMLWDAISKLQQETGIRFRRQHPLHPYVVDFACTKARLVIELDGYSHDVRHIYDAKRDADLGDRGWFIMRFNNEEVEKT